MNTSRLGAWCLANRAYFYACKTFCDEVEFRVSEARSEFCMNVCTDLSGTAPVQAGGCPARGGSALSPPEWWRG